MNNGKVTPCRKTGPPCGCKKNCYSLFSDSKRASIISEFSGSGDKDIQDSHCLALLEESLCRDVGLEMVLEETDRSPILTRHFNITVA